MNRIDLKTPTRALIFVLVTFLGPTVFSQDSSDFYEQTLYSSYKHITPSKVDEWKQESYQILSSYGVSTERLKEIQLNKWLGLWGMSDHIIQSPDFNSFKKNIEYWIKFLSLEGLDDYILNTSHNDPYHLLAMNLESWSALSSFMVNAGFFDANPKDPRSLHHFLVTTNWGEGVVTSRKSKAELWKDWAHVFASVPGSYLDVKMAFSPMFYEHTRNRDFIQRFYISLTKDLLSIVSRHRNLISTDLLVDFLNPRSGFMHSSFTYDMSKLFGRLEEMLKQNVKIKGLLLIEPIVQSIILELLNEVYMKPGLVDQRIELQKAIVKLYNKSESKKMCSAFLR